MLLVDDFTYHTMLNIIIKLSEYKYLYGDVLLKSKFNIYGIYFGNPERLIKLKNLKIFDIIVDSDILQEDLANISD